MGGTVDRAPQIRRKVERDLERSVGRSRRYGWCFLVAVILSLVTGSFGVVFVFVALSVGVAFVVHVLARRRSQRVLSEIGRPDTVAGTTRIAVRPSGKGGLVVDVLEGDDRVRGRWSVASDHARFQPQVSDFVEEGQGEFVLLGKRCLLLTPNGRLWNGWR